MKKYQSGASRSIHEMAESLYKHGAFDAKEMHEFDVDCLVPSAVPNRETFSYGDDNRPAAPIAAVAAPRG